MHPFDESRRRRAHKRRNIVQSAVLIAGLGLLMAVCAWILWGPQGILWAILGAGLAILIGPRVSPALAMRLFRARPFRPGEAAQLVHIVEALAARAGLNIPPKLHLVPSPTLNAFAVGKRDDAAIAVSAGLLQRLSLREIAGVLAHEISHIRNNDLWNMGLADVLSRITQLMSYFGVFLVLFNLPLIMTGQATVPWLAVALLYFAPTLGSLLQLALSRAREYDADLEGAQLTGDPAGLAAALEKLERYQGRFWEDMLPAGRRIPVPSLLRTHPPTEERVRRLLEFAAPPEPHVAVPDAAPRLAGLAPLHPRPRHHWPGVWF